MTKFLITGGNGFVANNLIKSLLRNPENDINISTRKFRSSINDRVSVFEKMHLSPSTNWNNLLINVDCVIHCAAQVHRSPFFTFFRSNTYEKINKLATLNLLEQAEHMNIKQFIYISSLVASNDNRLDRPYARSKYEAEQEIINFCKKSKIQYTILRPPLIYGINSPGNFKKLLWIIRYLKIIPYPSNLNAIPILFISNFINLIESCVGNKKSFGKIFEVSDNDNLNLKDLVLLIGEIFNLNVFLFKIPTKFMRLLNPFGVTSLFGQEQSIDNSHLEQQLGWRPPFSTRDALKSMSDNLDL